MKTVDGHVVFSWPETQKLLDRLGVIEQPTTGIDIRIFMDEAVKVEHTFLGEDMNREFS